MQNTDSKTNLEEIKQRVDIVDVISNYVRLEKSGTQFKGRCPFHNEKSPSFYVSPAKNFYHCFGCAAHGDIFTFTMNIENIPFKDALKLMAEKAGVSLSTFKKEENSRSFEILEKATIFFQKNLQESFEARGYVEGRGITAETTHLFRIGFAINDWRTLYSFLLKSGFSDEEILESGLCIKHEKGFYDRFRSRIMFPITNTSGKVVAFTGRIIGPDANKEKEGIAKYVNSPETSLYHKSSVLFGFDKAKTEIAKQKKVILVEGQMDTVMSHQAGVVNTVAISGTALTEAHVNILKRFADTVVLSLDTDKAGFEAMKKSAQISLFYDMHVEGLDIVDAKDPADIICDSPQAWLEISQNPISIFKLLTKKIIEGEKEGDNLKISQRIKKEILPILASVRSQMSRESYAKDVQDVSGIKSESVLAELKDLNIANDLTQIEQSKVYIKKEETVKKIVDISLLFISTFVFIEKLSTSKQEMFRDFLLNILKDFGDTEILEVLENEDLKNIERIKLEKDMQEKMVNKNEEQLRELISESVFVAVRGFLEKIRASTNIKNKETFNEENFVLLKKINSKLDTLKKEIEKL